MDYIEKILSFLTNNFPFAAASSLFIFYFQRYLRLKENLKSEKNKFYAENFVNCCDTLFNEVSNVRNKFNITQGEYVSHSNNILKLVQENYLYLPDGIIKICKDFSDYLLEISTNSISRNKKLEDTLMKKFKKEYSK